MKTRKKLVRKIKLFNDETLSIDKLLSDRQRKNIRLNSAIEFHNNLLEESTDKIYSVLFNVYGEGNAQKEGYSVEYQEYVVIKEK